MTPSDLRTGAALVRCLVEGDETVRLVLADWIEEHGLPAGLPGREYTRKWVVEFLRSGEPFRPEALEYSAEEIHVFAQTPARVRYRLGCWPSWSWEGTEREATETVP